MEDNRDFTVECNVCGHWYENWVGSTPCCGSIAYLVQENGEVTKKVSLYSSVGVATIDFGNNED